MLHEQRCMAGVHIDDADVGRIRAGVPARHRQELPIGRPLRARGFFNKGVGAISDFRSNRAGFAVREIEQPQPRRAVEIVLQERRVSSGRIDRDRTRKKLIVERSRLIGRRFHRRQRGDILVPFSRRFNRGLRGFGRFFGWVFVHVLDGFRRLFLGVRFHRLDHGFVELRIADRH